MGEDYEPFMQASCADLAAPICGKCDDCQPVVGRQATDRCRCGAYEVPTRTGLLFPSDRIAHGYAECVPIKTPPAREAT